MSSRAETWTAKVTGRRTLLKSKFFHVVEEDVRIGRKRFTYQFRPGGNVVHMVALTPRRDLVLIRQYRHPVRGTLLELPAGNLDPGESALAGAKRELLEETGYAARRWVTLGRWHPSPASTDMKSSFLLALDARKVRRPALDANEFLRVELRPFGRVLRTVHRLPNAPIGLHLGVLLAARRLGLLRLI